jgi:hypothetical protein
VHMPRVRVSAGAKVPWTVRDGALEYEVAIELPAMIGANPIEDVMHLGSWIQLYTIMHAGAKPSHLSVSRSTMDDLLRRFAGGHIRWRATLPT